LDLEGVHSNAVLGDDEPEEETDSNAEDTLEGVQADIILTTSLKNDA
jgi:hypothetical protein